MARICVPTVPSTMTAPKAQSQPRPPLCGLRFHGVTTFLYQLGMPSLNLPESRMHFPELHRKGLTLLMYQVTWRKVVAGIHFKAQ